jgi:hypothetical protein
MSDVEAATSDQMGLPRYPDHLSGVPCPLPRRIETGACVDCFPAHAAFPVLQAGRHPHLYFRGLLRLYSRYGPSDRSTAQGGLCHEASIQSVTRPNRSSATRAIDNSLGGTLLHWWSAPSGRTAKFKKNAARKIEETAARMENDRNGPHQARFDVMSPYAPGEAKSGEPDFESGH